MSAISGKRVLLIVSGGIAAYKTLELIRRLREKGISVRAVLTAAAQQFVTPLSVASLSGDKVFTDLFSLTDEAAIGHIELSRDADLLVVAPATADLLAKMAHGLADDLASTLLLATDKKILVAPAMNLRMWLAPATVRNVATLRGDGVIFSRAGRRRHGLRRIWPGPDERAARDPRRDRGGAIRRHSLAPAARSARRLGGARRPPRHRDLRADA